MKKNLSLLFICISVVCFSCKKNIGPNYYFPPTVPARPDTDSSIIKMNRDIAAILERVYQNDSAYREVLAAIFSGYYLDERVLLRDLLFPEISALYATEKFTSRHTGKGVFKREFNRVLQNGTYPVLRSALETETEPGTIPKTAQLADAQVLAGTASILSGSTAAAIYFPYSANFITGPGATKTSMPATIVAADREANSAPGRAPSLCAAGVDVYCYHEVIVNDGYADSIATHVVTNGATPASSAPQPPALAAVMRVYMGWARLTRQMDALISFTGNGGGSEIKIARLSGYLKKESEQVSSFEGDVVTLQFTRGEIRHKEWKKVYSIWDPNWEKGNTQQVFAVYEDDTKGTKTFSGSLTTTVGLPNIPPATGSTSTNKATGEISYKVEVSTQDDIITQRKLDRSSFLAMGTTSQGWGFVGDQQSETTFMGSWPVYDGGTIWSYSMPWKTD